MFLRLCDFELIPPRADTETVMKLSERCLIHHSGSPIICPLKEKLYKRPCSEKKRAAKTEQEKGIA